MGYKVIGPLSLDTTATRPTILRYDSIGTSNAVKLLPRIDSWNGYIKLYSELDSHFEVNDLIYISFSGDTSYYFSTEFAYGVNQLTLDNEILATYDINYPYSTLLNGYKILYINQNENSFAINKLISDLVPGALIYNHYASKVRCGNLSIQQGSVDSSFIFTGTINTASGSTSAVDWVQGVMLGGNVFNTNLDDKYPVNYITMWCSHNTTTNEISKNVNLNNNGLGYSYFYNLNNSIADSTIGSGSYYNCSFSTYTATTIDNGYLNNCFIRNYVINNGIFENCTLSKVLWNYGTWRNVALDKPFPALIWYDGIFDSGVFNGTIWYNGIFNSGEFSSRTWANGTVNGGNFNYGTTWYTGIFNDGLIENVNFRGGIFNGGIIRNSNWYNGVFNGGTATACTWFDGVLNGGSFGNGYWLRGEFYNGTLNNSYILRGNFYSGGIADSNIYNGTVRGASMSNVGFYKGSIKDTLLAQNCDIFSAHTFAGEAIVKPHMVTNTATSMVETFVKFEFPFNNNFESPRDKGLYISGIGFRVAELDNILQIANIPEIPDPTIGGQINYIIKPNYIVTNLTYNSAWSNLRGIIMADYVKRYNRVEIEDGTFSRCTIANSDIYSGTFNAVTIRDDVNFYGGNFNGNVFSSSGSTTNTWYGGNFYNGLFGYKTTGETEFTDVISNTSLSQSAITTSIDAYTNADGTKDPSILVFEFKHVLDNNNNEVDGTTYFSQIMQNLTAVPEIELPAGITWNYPAYTNVTESGIIDFNGWCLILPCNIEESGPEYFNAISYVTSIDPPHPSISTGTDILVNFTVSGYTQGRLMVYLGQGNPVKNNYFGIGYTLISNQTTGNTIGISNCRNIIADGNYSVWIRQSSIPWWSGGTLSFVSIPTFTPYPLTEPVYGGFEGKITSLSYKIGTFTPRDESGSSNQNPTFNTNLPITTYTDMDFTSKIDNVRGLDNYNMSTPTPPLPLGCPNVPCVWIPSGNIDYHFNLSTSPNLHHDESVLGNNGLCVNTDLTSYYGTMAAYTPPGSLSGGTTVVTKKPWFCSCNTSYLSFSDSQYRMYPGFNGKSWRISNGRLQIAFKFPLMEKYINQKTYPIGYSTDGWPKSYSSDQWFSYWQDLYTYGWYIDRYITLRSTKYYTDWIMLPGLYKLPMVAFTTAYGSIVKNILSYNLPMDESKIKDSWLGGSFYNGTFQGRWYDYYSGKTYWRGGKWSNAWNGILQNNLEPTTAPNITAGSPRTLYNQDNANLLATGRYAESPPWVQKDQFYQNVVTPPTNKNKR